MKDLDDYCQQYLDGMWEDHEFLMYFAACVMEQGETDTIKIANTWLMGRRHVK